MDGLRASGHSQKRFSRRLDGRVSHSSHVYQVAARIGRLPSLAEVRAKACLVGEEQQELQAVAFQSSQVSLRSQLKVPTHRWVSSKHCLLDPCSLVSQENDQPSIGLCFLGVLGDNGMMNSKLSWCQSSVPQAWHLGIWCFHSEQLCTFGTTFQFEDPLTPA